VNVHVHAADDGGCGHSRLIWPVEALQKLGHDVTLGADLDVARAPALGHAPISVLVDADVVVFQRPLRRELVEIIPVLQRQGTAVVVEIDDDFHALPKGHPGRAVWAPMRNPDRNWRWLMAACEQADLVTCTTLALARRYAPHGRAAVLPNCVPAWYLDVHGVRDDRVTIGWPGSPQTHIGDLDVVGTAVADVVVTTGARFRAIGGSETLRILGVDGETVDWVPLTERGPGGYPGRVASLDIGIVPLADNTFNVSKSALKALEFAALGVVPVMSPSPDNVRMFQQGIGYLADTPADWARHLRRLIASPNERAEMAARGRDVMRAWTYEGNASRWWDAWAKALRNRRQGARAA
jgi:hypothetical protein